MSPRVNELGMVDAHLLELTEHGISVGCISRLSGVNHRGLSKRIKRAREGFPYKDPEPEKAEKLLAVTYEEAAAEMYVFHGGKAPSEEINRHEQAYQIEELEFLLSCGESPAMAIRRVRLPEVPETLRNLLNKHDRKDLWTRIKYDMLGAEEIVNPSPLSSKEAEAWMASHD